MGKTEIKIDSRELKRINRAEKYFKERFPRWTVSVEELEYGDYVCKDCAIEYKTTNDFVKSVTDKRIFNQCIDLAHNYKKPYVLIETEFDDMNKAISKSRFIGLRFSWSQYYGAIASLSQLLPVFIVKDFNTALPLMEQLFKKSNDKKIRDIKPIMNKQENAVITWLACPKHVGLNTAVLIQKKLNLNTLEDVLDLKKEDLLSVKGVGEETANIILKWIKEGE